jgi:hypothetical protein
MGFSGTKGWILVLSTKMIEVIGSAMIALKNCRPIL